MLFCPQVADTLLLVYSTGEDVHPLRQLCLDCCCAQGLPATCHTVLVSSLHGAGGLGPAAVGVRFGVRSAHLLLVKALAAAVLLRGSVELQRFQESVSILLHTIAE